MKIVIDIEADGLENPTKIWLIVAKDIATGELHVFRRPSDDAAERVRFLRFADGVDTWIGHNWLGYDYPILKRLLGLNISSHVEKSIDTLIVSKLVDYPRQGHSVEAYGVEFGLEKGRHTDWTKYSLEMEEYCIRDVEITYRIYLKYLRYISDERHRRSILLEHYFQEICNDLENNGFFFNKDKATKILTSVEETLSILDRDILEEFKPKLKLIRTITPKETKYGTISLSSIPKELRADLTVFTVGASFDYCRWVTLIQVVMLKLLKFLMKRAGLL